jgi:poly-gamma-glutamate capsule biosynthesis protein CapA/YwtB (metallophosphatase superfamily)
VNRLNTLLLSWLWFAVGCGSEKPQVVWHNADSSVPSTAQPMVAFRDGSQLVAAEVKRSGPKTATAEWWWSPGVRSSSVTFQVRLFPADGGKAIELDSIVVGEPSGSVVRVVLDIERAELVEDHPHWVSVRLRDAAGETIKAPPFPGHWVSVGVVPGVGVDVQAHSIEEGSRQTLAVGGDANLGRRQNGLSSHRGPADALTRIKSLVEADLSFINLECVLSEVGETALPKGEAVPHYFRGRQEQVQILTAAGIDVVGTANNHAGDYGHAALMDQGRILAAAGVLSAGSGATLSDACAPVFIVRDGVKVAFISSDATLSDFTATSSTPGTCHVPRDDVEAAMAILGPVMREARAQADVLFVAMHWGRNKKSRPARETRDLGAALIAAGADAVLGSSAHQVQGVEIIDGRPILYDSGNLLFDSHAEGEMARSGVFALEFDRLGVHRVEMRPIDVDYGYSRPAMGNSAARSLVRFRDLSAELGTQVLIREDVARIGLPPPPERAGPDAAVDIENIAHAAVPPADEPPAGCVADEVPAEAAITPVSWGPLQLLGVRMTPSTPTERRTVWVESWWRVQRPVPDDLWIYQRMKSMPHRPEFMWWADHEHCDWAWPTSRWKPGQIIRDVYGVRPPKASEPGPYQLVMGLIRDEARLGDSARLFSFQYQ